MFPSPISHASGIDPCTCLVMEKGYLSRKEDIQNTVFAFKYRSESTIGSSILYPLSQTGHAPIAIMKHAAIIIANKFITCT